MKGIKIGAINIRSLYKNIDHVKLLVQESKFLGLTESWRNSNVDGPEIEINNYGLFHYDGDAGISKRGGGIVVYCSNRFTLEHISNWDICTLI